ncbi:MAG TPA: Fur family transcriptional regulator [Alphaproteobacteria bacterium]|nr:Fur family transcriptional regulator [Alphaproteobacteria bacterium]
MKSASSKTCSKKRGCDAHHLGVNETSVQKILAKSDKPMSAYDIIPKMAKQLGHTVAPVTVYRALEHLSEHGLVTRIESKNAYVLCRHPEEDHDCMFFICRQCGTATEAADDKISRLLRKEASDIGFGINKQILEILGLCKACARKASAKSA